MNIVWIVLMACCLFLTITVILSIYPKQTIRALRNLYPKAICHKHD